MKRVWATLTLMTVVMVSSAMATGPMFDARMDCWSNNQVWKIVADDFNDDGILDLVSSHVQPSGVVTMNIGNGDGTFTFFDRWMPNGLQCYFMVSADLNNDGYPDLASIIKPAAASQLAILLGNGDGTFRGAVAGDTTYPWTQTIHLFAGLDVLDVDNDGYKDVIYGDADSVYALHNNSGDGTFAASPVAIIGGISALDFRSADINHDEYMDIVCYGLSYLTPTTYDTAMCTYINNGDGTFQSAVKTKVTFGQVISTAAGYGGFKLAYMNGDPELDVVLMDENRVIKIMLGNGTGAFAVSTGPQFDEGKCYDVADLDGDGAPDVVVCDGLHTVVSINNGDGTLRTPTKYLNLASAENFVAVDLNRDGAADLAGGNWPGAVVTVLLNHGDGSFAELDKVQMDEQLLDATTGDFNRDNHLDFAGLTVVAGPDTVISVRLGNGAGTFSAPIHTSGLEPSANILFAGDFNHDDTLDLAVAGWKFQTFFGNGDGTFTVADSAHADMAPSQSKIIGHDTNADDYMDLLFIDRTRFFTKLNNGDGTFGAAAVEAAPLASSLETITFADINNDGTDDWLLPTTRTLGSGSTVRRVYVYTTDSAGVRTYSQEVRPVGGALGVAAIDLNSDGWLDLVTESSFMFNNGDGTIADALGDDWILNQNRPTEILGRDMDDDGHVDLILGGKNSLGTKIIMNNGDGTLSNGQNYFVGFDPAALLPGDFDEDGLLDMAIGNQRSAQDTTWSYIAVLYNRGFGSGACFDPADYDSDGVGDFCDNCPLVGNAGQEDRNHDGVGDACSFADSASVGSQVLQNLGGGIQITFDSVNVGGSTAATYGNTGPAGGDAFAIIPTDLPGYYFVSTDADFVGTFELCITYDDFGLTVQEEGALSLLHHDGGQWVDITTSHNTVSNQICGVTDHLSPFAVGIAQNPTAVDDDDETVLPAQFALGQNYPNPFNPTTVIEYSLAERSHVEITVLNLLGQTVRNLINEEQGAGQHSITWMGDDSRGESVATGIYFYRIKTTEFVATRKMLLLK